MGGFILLAQWQGSKIIIMAFMIMPLTLKVANLSPSKSGSPGSKKAIVANFGSEFNSTI